MVVRAPTVEPRAEAREHLGHIPHEISVDFAFVDHHQAPTVRR
jgi:hypothetical protein